MQEKIFEAVCKEFNDDFFEDKWDEEPENGIHKSMLRHSMKKALLKLWELRNNPHPNNETLD